MGDKFEFDNVLTHLDKYETLIENYLIHQPDLIKRPDGDSNKFMVYQEPAVQIKQPKISIWEFMEQEDLKRFLSIKRKSDIRKHINQNFDVRHPRGTARKVFIELMYNITKFCKTSNLSLEKSGALLSQFYLTHLFFTQKLDMSAEKLYTFFKDLTMCHSLPFPPSSLKIFSHKETKEIMEVFCKLYLRNLPIIRFLCLPNFAFYMDYELEPEPALVKKAKKEKGGGEKKGGKKESKKGSKK